jgi:ribosomal protein S18 acetylase RimI-like enzyme
MAYNMQVKKMPLTGETLGSGFKTVTALPHHSLSPLLHPELISHPSTFTILPARTEEDMTTVKGLFQAYALSLGIDLSFQDFSTELAFLPGKYSPPQGEIFIAYDTSQSQNAIGCVALRPMAIEGCCEMKRLYVSPAARGLGLGRVLVKEIISAAKREGYKEIKLDTLDSMEAALKLYKEAGFVESECYYHTPLPNTTFMSLYLE